MRFSWLKPLIKAELPVSRLFSSMIRIPAKKNFLPNDADTISFVTAPVINICVAMLMFWVIPFSDKAVFADVEAGVFLVFGILCLDIFGFIMAGVGSNTKNSIIGGLRATRQAINARLVAFTSIIPIIISANSLQFVKIVEAQKETWFVFSHIVMFCSFVFSMLAFMLIKPFSLSDGTSEISGGYRAEYAGFSLFLFDVGDLLSMLAVSAFITIMFLGGWQAPEFFLADKIAPFLWFLMKMAVCLLLMIYINYKTPRFREDQLQSILWKILFPINVVWGFLTAGLEIINS